MRETMPLVIDSEVPPGGKTVGQHRVLDLWQRARPRDRRVGGEEAVVVELEDGEINARCDRLDGGGDLITGTRGLDLHVARVEHGVRIGQDAMPLDDDSRGGDILGRLLGPGPNGSGCRRVANTLTTPLLRLVGIAAAPAASSAALATVMPRRAEIGLRPPMRAISIISSVSGVRRGADRLTLIMGSWKAKSLKLQRHGILTASPAARRIDSTGAH